MVGTQLNLVSRIVGHDRVRADQLLANPFNHRRHPQKQRDVVSSSLRLLGSVKSVLVNRTTGHIVDGHERAMQALGVGDGTLVDVEYVELTEEEERKALFLLDASRDMAGQDSVTLSTLLEEADLPSGEFDSFVLGLVNSDSTETRSFDQPTTKFVKIEIVPDDVDLIVRGVSAILESMGIDAKVEAY